jgi:hypothetical protein
MVGAWLCFAWSGEEVWLKNLLALLAILPESGALRDAALKLPYGIIGFVHH